MKRVAILQSNYIPWKGYFDLINSVDEFVIYDDVQYTRRDWRNRNKIKASDGLKWLTIPVEVKGKYLQKINETRISDKEWPQSHWSAICQLYGKARYFKEYKGFFEDLYLGCSDDLLSQVNFRFMKAINELLGIKTTMRWSSEFDLVDGQSERLLGICKATSADVYLSGPAAKDYLDESLFAGEGIVVEWMQYDGYPEYEQLFPPFEHGVSVIDLILNAGPSARDFMKSFK